MARASRLGWPCQQTSLDKVVKRILAVDGGEPGDRPPATGNNDLGAFLHAVEMLTEPVVELSDTNLDARAR